MIMQRYNQFYGIRHIEKIRKH